MSKVLLAIGAGGLAGFLGALCGVGGGIVMVPAFVTLLSLTQKQAVATSLAVIVVIALVSTVKNAQASLIDWQVAAATAGGAVIAAYFGTDLMASLRNDTLSKLFGVVLIVFGVHMLLRKTA